MSLKSKKNTEHKEKKKKDSPEFKGLSKKVSKYIHNYRKKFDDNPVRYGSILAGAISLIIIVSVASISFLYNQFNLAGASTGANLTVRAYCKTDNRELNVVHELHRMSPDGQEFKHNSYQDEQGNKFVTPHTRRVSLGGWINVVLVDNQGNQIATKPVEKVQPENNVVFHLDKCNVDGSSGSSNFTSINLKAVCLDDGRELSRDFLAVREGDIKQEGKTPETIEIPGGTEKGSLVIAITGEDGKDIFRTVSSYTKSEEVLVEFSDCALADSSKNRFSLPNPTPNQIKIQAICEENRADLQKNYLVYGLESDFAKKGETPELININEVPDQVLHIKVEDQYRKLDLSKIERVATFNFDNCK
jgi:hypothetical protein